VKKSSVFSVISLKVYTLSYCFKETSTAFSAVLK